MRTQEIEPLTGLRGVAALWVFVFHIADWFGRLGSAATTATRVLGGAGYLGVDIFFVLSGFVLALNYSDLNLRRGRTYLSFLRKRLARIYPVHLFALALLALLQVIADSFGSAIFPRSWFSIEGLIATLTLTHAWSMPIPKTWNLVSWSISCEWAAYLAFPVVVLAANQIRSPRLALLCIALAFTGLALVVSSAGYPGTLAYGMPRIAAEFSSGVLLHRLWKMRHHEIRPSNDKVAMAGLAGLIVGGNMLALATWHAAPLMFLPVLATAVVYGLAAGDGWLGRRLASPVALWAGRISYSFYMVHLIVIKLVAILLRRLPIPFGTSLHIAGAVIAMVLSAVLAHWIYRNVEVPARQWMIQRSRGHLQ